VFKREALKVVKLLPRFIYFHVNRSIVLGVQANCYVPNEEANHIGQVLPCRVQAARY
jgi:hypothetical protein